MTGEDRNPPPDFEAARDHVVTELIRFARRLRGEGVRMPANASLDAARALAAVGIDDRDRVRAALRASLLSDDRDSRAFEQHFPEFWTRLRAGLQRIAAGETGVESEDPASESSTVSVEIEGDLALDESTGADGLGAGDRRDDRADPEADDRLAAGGPDAFENGSDADDRDPAGEMRSSTYSPQGRRSSAEVGESGPGHALDERALARFEDALVGLPGRRYRPADTGERLDARRTLRENVQSGGTALALPREERERSELRCCVLVDVSQSVLDTVDRAFLLAFLDRFQERNRSVRTFIFDTDIREVTDVFADGGESPLATFERAGVEWGGGTRIGESIATLRREWPYAVDRRTALLIVSDGLDVGEVETLESGMAWLSHRAKAILWLNPLAGSPEYEPTCRGMAAALPYADGLFPFADGDDVAEIARQLERQGLHGSIGYRHDSRRASTGG